MTRPATNAVSTESWLHCDQAPSRRGWVCVQGLVNLVPVSADTTGASIPGKGSSSIYGSPVPTPAPGGGGGIPCLKVWSCPGFEHEIRVFMLNETKMMVGPAKAARDHLVQPLRLIQIAWCLSCHVHRGAGQHCLSYHHKHTHAHTHTHTHTLGERDLAYVKVLSADVLVALHYLVYAEGPASVFMEALRHRAGSSDLPLLGKPVRHV